MRFVKGGEILSRGTRFRQGGTSAPLRPPPPPHLNEALPILRISEIFTKNKALSMSGVANLLEVLMVQIFGEVDFGLGLVDKYISLIRNSDYIYLLTGHL